MEKLNVIISGGGTGGHIFPAISIANGIKEINPDANILFVGATGRMEMERIPAAGYEIIGIPAQGLRRPLYHPYNLKVALDYLRCRMKAKRIIRNFKPNVIVGVGGYASAAIVGAASNMGLPILLQEQNSFAGIVNRSNGKHADKICVAYDNMERFFPKDKIILTGNPIRKDIAKATQQQKEEGYKFYFAPWDMDLTWGNVSVGEINPYYTEFEKVSVRNGVYKNFAGRSRDCSEHTVNYKICRILMPKET